MAKRKKIVTVVGARPQFIKMSGLSRLIADSVSIEEIIVHTGQHFDHSMSESFFGELDLPQPSVNLGIAGGYHGRSTGQMLENIENCLLSEKPDAVLVYGDTNSTLAGALAASKLHIPVFHVEAGLRSFNKTMPEEINRILTDHVSNELFCPTPVAVKNLQNENIREGVHHVGDIMYDVALSMSERAKKCSNILQTCGVIPNKYILVTLHRAENTDSAEHLTKLLDYVRQTAKVEGIKIVFPVHPRTQARVKQFNFSLDEFGPIDPVSYLDMTVLMSNAQIIMTDSGGIQKEAYFHQVPCITLREETEWVETIEYGWNRLWRQPTYRPRRMITDYGEGNTGLRIQKIIKSVI